MIQVGLSCVEIVLILSRVVPAVTIDDEVIIMSQTVEICAWTVLDILYLLFLNDLGHFMVEGHLMRLT